MPATPSTPTILVTTDPSEVQEGRHLLEVNGTPLGWHHPSRPLGLAIEYVTRIEPDAVPSLQVTVWNDLWMMDLIIPLFNQPTFKVWIP